MAIRLVKTDRQTVGEIILDEYLRALEIKNQANLDFAEQEARMLNFMGDTKSGTIGSKRITVVRREITKINEPKLKKLLGAVVYNKITNKVLDRAKLESMISIGDISIEQVASASEIIPSKPYVRVSDVQALEES